MYNDFFGAQVTKIFLGGQVQIFLAVLHKQLQKGFPNVVVRFLKCLYAMSVWKNNYFKFVFFFQV